jgi:hypothetical protein
MAHLTIDKIEQIVYLSPIEAAHEEQQTDF